MVLFSFEISQMGYTQVVEKSEFLNKLPGEEGTTLFFENRDEQHPLVTGESPAGQESITLQKVPSHSFTGTLVIAELSPPTEESDFLVRAAGAQPHTRAQRKLKFEKARNGYARMMRTLEDKWFPSVALRLSGGAPTGFGVGIEYYPNPKTKRWTYSFDYSWLFPLHSAQAQIRYRLPSFLKRFEVGVGVMRNAIGPVWRRVTAYEANAYLTKWQESYGIFDINFALPQSVFALNVIGPTASVTWNVSRRLSVSVGLQYANWQRSIEKMYDQVGEHLIERTRQLKANGIATAEDVEAVELLVVENKEKLFNIELPKFVEKTIGSNFMPTVCIVFRLPWGKTKEKFASGSKTGNQPQIDLISFAE